MPSSKRFIIVTGGGTGGHVFPALAICKELLSRGFEVLYIGSPRGMEAKLAPMHKVPFQTIQTGQVKNQSKGQMILNLFQTFGCCIYALFSLLKKRPAAIIGVGGYVSFPYMIAGAILFIPIFIQEQNVTAGIANRVLMHFAKKVFLGFPSVDKGRSSSRFVVTGNPIRPEFLSPKFDEYTTRPLQLLVMGGSQGARAINNAMVSFLPKLEAEFPGIQIFHQTGSLDFERIQEAYKNFGTKHTVLPFIDNMAEVYQKTTLILCRSGALTVSEIMSVKRPAIFVPYPRKGQNDQTANAYYMKSLGLAEVVEQGDDFENRLWRALLSQLKESRLGEMHRAFSQLPPTSAVVTIGDHIQSELQS